MEEVTWGPALSLIMLMIRTVTQKQYMPDIYHTMLGLAPNTYEESITIPSLEEA